MKQPYYNIDLSRGTLQYLGRHKCIDDAFDVADNKSMEGEIDFQWVIERSDLEAFFTECMSILEDNDERD